MAKSRSKSKKRRNPSSGSGLNYTPHQPKVRRRRDNMIMAVIIISAALGIGGYWWWSSATESEFLALAAEGEPALINVKTDVSDGGGHYAAHESQSYPSKFPTSGRYHPVPTEPGFYKIARSPGQLVHAVEHGHIVIYYDQPGADALATLEKWAGQYSGHWDGVVVTPMPGLREKIVLTAWVKTLKQKRFNAAGAAAFIDKFRGRGPENPVR
ncbi:MAG: DUF3105 domain-containing protein [Rhodospirillaceae bacterium]|nr:DUF3105 domain-containing protein [Rhodospirillaceae bacterium]